MKRIAYIIGCGEPNTVRYASLTEPDRDAKLNVYGDSITLQRQEKILSGLKAKGLLRVDTINGVLIREHTLEEIRDRLHGVS